MAFSVSYIYSVIDKYTPKLDKINKVTDSFDRKVKGVQGGLRKMNQRLVSMQGAAATAAGVLGGAGMARTFLTFEENMLAAKAVTRATDEQFDALSDRAQALGRTTAFTAAQAASGIEMLGRNGLTTTQILGGAIDASLSLAAATGTNLANSANIATDVMANFDQKAGDMLNVVDKIAGVTVKSKFNIDDYRLALGMAGGVAGQVGVSLQDFNTTIAALAPSFASGMRAGTSLKVFLQRLNPQSKEAAEVMKALGLNFFDASGKMKSMSDIAGMLNKAFSGLTEKQISYAGSTMFGTDAIITALGLAKIGGKEFNNLAAAIDKVSATKLAEDRLGGLSGTLKILKSTYEGLIIAIFKSGLADIFISIGKSATKFVRQLTASNPTLLKFIGITTTVAVMLGPVLIGLGLLSGALAALISPVSAIIAGIGAVGIALVTFYNKNENVKDAVDSLWESLKSVYTLFSPLIDKLKEFFSITGGGGDMLNMFAAIIKSIATAIEFWVGVIERAIDVIPKLMGKIKGFVTDKITGEFFELQRKTKGLLAKLGIGKKEAVFGEPIEQSATAGRSAAMTATLNGMINVSSTGGATVDSASFDTNLPGNLGFNLAQ
jgi:TP901 family phage tail tape measure protein